MASSLPPRSRGDFHIAILCAKPLEADAVILSLDQIWEEDKRYKPLKEDRSSYTWGAIGSHNVVIVHMPGLGANRAEAAAGDLRHSYPSVKFTLIVGVCGGMPKGRAGDEILLGDVVISQLLIQYDFGKEYDKGFEKSKDALNTLGAPTERILGLLAKMEAEYYRQKLQIKTAAILQVMGQKTLKFTHPGLENDILYDSSYPHQHRKPGECSACETTEKICEDAIVESCEDLGCTSSAPISRQRSLYPSQTHPIIHIGPMGCANRVLKSGLTRDKLARDDHIIAVEMEGAGVWRHGPSLVIKGVCDYADGHKRKNWQRYAAAAAAACTKAFLLEWWAPETHGNSSGQALPAGEISSSQALEADSFSDVFSKPTWYAPFDPMPGFVGRQDEFRQLEQKLFAPGSARVAALLGLGGVGKSRLALELASRIRSRYMVLWVQASEQSTFDNDMLNIGKKLGIPGIQDQGQDFRALVKQQLSSSEQKWVLILDNADDTVLWGKGATSGSTQTSLMEYLPRSSTGSILVTTRSRKVANCLAEAEIIELLPPPADQAREMFIERLQNPDLAADQDALSALLDELAYLPLALVQAASFINETQRPVRTYLDLMSSAEESVLKLLSQDFGDRSRYRKAINPIATTWHISFKHIRTHFPLAATILSRMACVHEKNIPQSPLQDDNSESDDLDFINAIAILTGYSFVTVMSGSSSISEETYDMHRLVQLAARSWLKLEGTTSAYVRASTARLAQLFPVRNHEHKSIWTMYLPHARRLCDQAEEGLPERYDLLEKMGLCLVVDGQYDEAVKAHTLVVDWREKLGVFDRRTFEAYNNLGEALSWNGKLTKAKQYLQRAFDWQKDWLGNDDHTTLTSMSNLARVLHHQGKYGEAESMYRQVLEVRERVLGKEHPSTLTSMNNLAGVLSDQGKYGEAESMYRQVLEARERVLGKEHPSTLTSMNNLALVLGAQGKYGEAESMYRQVLEVAERVLGKEHPSTLTSMNNLALVLSDQGKYGEAESMYRQVLEVAERVLSKEHPSTLTSMNNLAGVLGAQGKYGEAESMYRQVLEVWERVLGKEHPSTLASMNNLAGVLSDQGKYGEAESMYREVLEVRERVLGKEHPSTLASMNNLAGVLSNQGKHVEAESMYRQVLEVRERVLGKEHPSTLASMDNLALVLSNQGKYGEAESMHRQVLEVRERVLGKEHPQKLTSVNNLAGVLRDQGKYGEAESMRREVLEVRERVLGKEHPSTLASMNDLALVLRNQGKYVEAESMHRQVLEVAERVLGKEHPSTLASMNNLAGVLSNQEKYGEAERMQVEAVRSLHVVLGPEHPNTEISLTILMEIWESQGREAPERERMLQDIIKIARRL